MQDDITPDISDKDPISKIWLLPLLAILLAGWLLYKKYQESGIDIQVFFPDANGIIAKKTLVKYRGLQVGLVKAVELIPDGSGVIANIEMDKQTEPYLTDKLQMWLVRPRAGIEGISGLETLFSGTYIQVDGPKDTTDGNVTRYYEALLSPPPAAIPEVLATYTLLTKNASGLYPGAPVYHKSLQVGKVHDVQLETALSRVSVTIALDPKYQALVKRNSRFWNISGFKLKADLSGVKMDTESLASVIFGGIAFSSPAGATEADENSIFPLYDNIELARKAVEIKLYLPKTADVHEGTKIYYQAQQIGSVQQVRWNNDHSQLVAEARLDLDTALLVTNDAYFWTDVPSIDLDNFAIGGLLQGTVIRLQPGNETLTGDEFTVHEQAPVNHDNSLRLSLTSSSAQGIKRGTNIYYQGWKIGNVNWIRFDNDQLNFDLEVLVQSPYAKLIGQNTRFYREAAMSLNANWQQVEVKIPGLNQLLNGGISIISQHQQTAGQIPETFNLYEDYQAAQSSLQKGATQVTLIPTPETSMPSKGTAVIWQKIEIGQVSFSGFNPATSRKEVTLSIQHDFKDKVSGNFSAYVNEGIKMSASLEGINFETQSLLSLLKGSIEIDPISGESPKERMLFKDKKSAHAPKANLVLTIRQNTNLKAGAKVLYRGFEVGTVLTAVMSKDLSSVVAEIKLQNKYQDHFLKEGSRFWLLQPNIGLTNNQHLAGFILGDQIVVEPGSGTFKDHFDTGRAQEGQAGPGRIAQLTASELGSLKVGDPLLFKQLPVGQVSKVGLNNNRDVVVWVRFFEDYDYLLNDTCLFWNASGIKLDAGLFSGITVETESFETILSGGVAFECSETIGAHATKVNFVLHDNKPFVEPKQS